MNLDQHSSLSLERDYLVLLFVLQHPKHLNKVFRREVAMRLLNSELAKMDFTLRKYSFSSVSQFWFSVPRDPASSC